MSSDFGSVAMVETLEHDDSVEVSIPTERQKFIPSFLPALSYYMNLHPFIECKSENSSSIDIVLYSDFAPDKNYVVYISSCMFGLINRVVVEFFRSQETMYRKLNYHLYHMPCNS